MRRGIRNEFSTPGKLMLSELVLNKSLSKSFRIDMKGNAHQIFWHRMT